MKYLIVLLVTILFGCGSNIQHNSFQTDDYKIIFSGSLSNNPIARDEINAAVIYTMKTWELKYGRLPYFNVIVSKDHINVKGEAVNGIWYGNNTIEVWAGDKLELPALYHEFCHLAFHLYDHSDPRWPEWDEECNKCYHNIDMNR